MFPTGPEREPEPDVIGTPRAGRRRLPQTRWGRWVQQERRERWRRWGWAGSVLVLAGAVAALAVPSLTSHHPAQPAPATTPAASAPSPEPGPPAALVPPRQWAASLNVATWPVEQISAGPASDRVFALGVAGQHGWSLAVRAITRPGEGCVAEVTLLGGLPSSPPQRGVPPFPLPPRAPGRTPGRTPVGDPAFLALGSGARGAGVAFVRESGPGGTVWANPNLVGELIISVPVVTVSACGRQYYLAGFAYPLQGALDLSATRSSGGPAEYVAPERLTRPAAQDVWQPGG